MKMICCRCGNVDEDRAKFLPTDQIGATACQDCWSHYTVCQGCGVLHGTTHMWEGKAFCQWCCRRCSPIRPRPEETPAASNRFAHIPRYLAMPARFLETQFGNELTASTTLWMSFYKEHPIDDLNRIYKAGVAAACKTPKQVRWVKVYTCPICRAPGCLRPQAMSCHFCGNRSTECAGPCGDVTVEPYACIDGTYQCAGCVGQNPRCASCDKHFTKNVPADPKLAVDGSQLCQRCHDAFVRPCERPNCGKPTLIRGAAIMALNAAGVPQTTCSACVQTLEPCENCPIWCEKLIDKGGRELCPRCALGLLQCKKCKAFYDKDDGACNGCRVSVEEYGQKAERRFPFFGAPDSHKPCRKARKLKRLGEFAHLPGCGFDGLYFGVELEVEMRRGEGFHREEVATTIKEMIGHGAIVKRDGSLSNGFEIVTAPGTMEWHQAFWQPFFDWHRRTLALKSHDTTTCGLHVHVTRGPLAKTTIAKMVQFLHTPANSQLLIHISGRPAGEYQDWLVPKLYKTEKQTQEFGYDVDMDNQNRYTALNLCNKHTVEFRIFRGTMNRFTFMARLEFCKALVKFADNPMRAFDDMTSEHFFDFLTEWRKQYRFLAAYMVVAGYLEPTDNESEILAEKVGGR